MCMWCATTTTTIACDSVWRDDGEVYQIRMADNEVYQIACDSVSRLTPNAKKMRPKKHPQEHINNCVLVGFHSCQSFLSSRGLRHGCVEPRHGMHVSTTNTTLCRTHIRRAQPKVARTTSCRTLSWWRQRRPTTERLFIGDGDDVETCCAFSTRPTTTKSIQIACGSQKVSIASIRAEGGAFLDVFRDLLSQVPDSGGQTYTINAWSTNASC